MVLPPSTPPEDQKAESHVEISLQRIFQAFVGFHLNDRIQTLQLDADYSGDGETNTMASALPWPLILELSAKCLPPTRGSVGTSEMKPNRSGPASSTSTWCLGSKPVLIMHHICRPNWPIVISKEFFDQDMDRQYREILEARQKIYEWDLDTTIRDGTPTPLFSAFESFMTEQSKAIGVPRRATTLQNGQFESGAQYPK
ncbi:hypothetical protein NHQ30_005177 [Ciborinia camelliae]|nr:hypothetical protein NHQ30_005177 [Ciborinia camelliae]